MKKYLLLLLICFSLQGLTQDFDQMVARRPFIGCEDVAFNAKDIIERYWSIDQMDSVRSFLDYWMNRCGHMEEIERTKHLLEIKTGTFVLDSINENLLIDLANYRRKVTPINIPGYYYMFTSFGYSIRVDGFDKFSRKIALLMESDDPDLDFIIDFYASEKPDFSRLTTEEMASTKLAKEYNKLIEKTLDQPTSNFSLGVGFVDHQGDLSPFGFRPLIGFALGAKHKRHNYNFIADFRMGPSQEEYSFEYLGSVIDSTSWRSAYLGLEYTYDFIDKKYVSLGASGGIGLDRVSAIIADEEDEVDGVYLPGFNRNVGLDFRHWFKNNSGGYLGLQFRVNWTDIKNPGLPTMSGTYYTLKTVIGIMDNEKRFSTLKLLQ